MTKTDPKEGMSAAVNATATVKRAPKIKAATSKQKHTKKQKAMETIEKTVPVATQPVEKTRYSDTELAEFKAILLKKLSQAQTTLAELNNLKENVSENSHYELGDMAANSHEIEQINNLISRQTELIKKMRGALNRIVNRTYGICRMTGKLIPKPRLKAVPHATLCVDAKESRNTLPSRVASQY